MDECPICSSKSVIEEEENGEKVRVCTDCGAMDHDMQEYTSSADIFEGTSGTYGEGRAPDNIKSWMKTRVSASTKGKLTGGQLIKQIGNVFKLSEGVISEAIHLFERIYDEELYKHLMTSRRVMCVACLFAMSRIHHCGLTARDIGPFLNVENPVVRFGAALKSLKIKYDVHLPLASVTAETYGLLSQVKFPSHLIKQTQQLMQLLERAWITGGRSNSVCIVAASYFVWKADNYLTNKKISLKKFCGNFSLSYNTNTWRRKCAIESALQTLVQELPWIKASDKKDVDIEPNLKDVIKYQSSLLHLAITTVIEELKEKLDDNDDNVEGDVDDDDKDIELASQHLEEVTQCGNIFRLSSKRKDTSKTDVAYNDVEDSTSKKKYKISTSPRKLSPKKVDLNTGYSSGDNSGLESLDLGSDDDTDLYIIPEDEVAKRQLLLLQAEVKDS